MSPSVGHQQVLKSVPQVSSPIYKSYYMIKLPLVCFYSKSLAHKHFISFLAVIAALNMVMCVGIAV